MIEDMGFAKGGNVSVIGAAMIAGFFASACSLPFDYVKTQIQKMKPDPVTGELPFKSPIDCAMKTLRAGGPLKFYTGFPTYFVRIAPHGMKGTFCDDVCGCCITWLTSLTQLSSHLYWCLHCPR